MTAAKQGFFTNGGRREEGGGSQGQDGLLGLKLKTVMLVE